MDIADSDKKSVEECLPGKKSKNKYDFVYGKWCTCKSNSHKRDKRRIVLLTQYRLFYIKKGLRDYKLRQNLCLVDLELINATDHELLIQFHTCTAPLIILGDKLQVLELLIPLLTHSDRLTKYLPEDLKPKLEIDAGLIGDFVPVDISREDHFILMYSTLCNKQSINESNFIINNLTKQTLTDSINLGSTLFGQKLDDAEQKYSGEEMEDARVDQMKIQSFRQHVHAISFALLHTNLFQHFTIKNANFDDKSMSELVKIFPTNDSINNVYIENVHTGTATLKKFAREAKEQRYGTFSLRKTSIGDHGMSYLAHFLKTCQIGNLVLANCSLGSRGVVKLSAALEHPNLANITYLDLQRNNPGEKGSAALGKWLKKVKYLESLKLSRCDTFVIFASLLDNEHDIWSKRLRRFVVLNSQILNPAGLLLEEIMSETKSIQFINLSHCKFEAEGVSNVFTGILLPRSNADLRFVICMRGCHLDRDAAFRIAAVMKKRDKNALGIESLLLGDNRFGVRGIAALCEQIGHLGSMENLELDGNISGGVFKNSQPAFDQLYKLIKGTPLPNLKYLSIAGSSGRAAKEGIRPLITAMSDNTAITELDISHNKIGDDVLFNIGSALKANFTLKVLKMDYNSAGYQTISAISQTLANDNNGTLFDIVLDNDIKSYRQQHSSSQRKLDEFNTNVAEITRQLAINSRRGQPAPNYSKRIFFEAFQENVDIAAPDIEFSKVHNDDEKIKELEEIEAELAQPLNRHNKNRFSIMEQAIFSDDEDESIPDNREKGRHNISLQDFMGIVDEEKESEYELSEDDLQSESAAAAAGALELNVDVHLKPGSSPELAPSKHIQPAPEPEIMLEPMSEHNPKENKPQEHEAIESDIDENLAPRNESPARGSARDLLQQNTRLQTQLADLRSREKSNVDDLSRKVEELQDEKLCIICMEKPRDTVLLNCFHLHFCGECVEDLDSCPTCRQEIVGRQKVFD